MFRACASSARGAGAIHRSALPRAPGLGIAALLLASFGCQPVQVRVVVSGEPAASAVRRLELRDGCDAAPRSLPLDGSPVTLGAGIYCLRAVEAGVDGLCRRSDDVRIDITDSITVELALGAWEECSVAEHGLDRSCATRGLEPLEIVAVEGAMRAAGRLACVLEAGLDSFPVRCWGTATGGAQFAPTDAVSVGGANRIESLITFTLSADQVCVRDACIPSEPDATWPPARGVLAERSLGSGVGCVRDEIGVRCVDRATGELEEWPGALDLDQRDGRIAVVRATGEVCVRESLGMSDTCLPARGEVVRLAAGNPLCAVIRDAATRRESIRCSDGARNWSGDDDALHPRVDALCSTGADALEGQVCAASNGEVWCWDRGSTTPHRIEGLPEIADIACGDAFVCARTLGGRQVWCWGENGDDRQLGGARGSSPAQVCATAS